MNKKVLYSLIVAITLVSGGCQSTGVMPASNGGQTVSNSQSVFSLVDLSDRIRFIGKSDGSDILTKADDIFFRIDENEGKLIFGDVDYTNNEKKMKFLFNQLLEWDKGYVDLTLNEDQDNNSTDQNSEGSSDSTSNGDEKKDLAQSSDSDSTDSIDKSEEEKLISLIGGEISDRDKVTTIMLELEKSLASLNMKLPNEIKLCKFDSIFVDEDAFTVNDTIFLSEDLIKGHKQVLKEELIRQLTYMYLNNNDDKADRLYSTFGFVKCPELFESSELGKIHVNPSYPIVKYAFEGMYKGKSMKFMPVETIEVKTTTDSDGNETSKISKEIKFYAVEVTEDSTKLLKFDSSLTVNDSGMPLGVKIDDMDNFYNYFTHTHDVNNNPKRIVADYVVDMLTGRGNNDTKIHNTITSIISN